MLGIVLAVLAGICVYGGSLSLCFAGMIRIYQSLHCTSLCQEDTAEVGYGMVASGLTIFVVFLVILLKSSNQNIS